jgi:RNA-directed DNA polymerase
MKRTLIQEVRRIQTLSRAWNAVRRNGRSSKSEQTREEIAAFETDSAAKLNTIQRRLQAGTFRFQPAHGKKIPKKTKGAFRPLVVAPVESRIVQRAVHDVLTKLPETVKYTNTPYSFGGMKKSADDDLASVPAAIRCVLHAIEGGAKYIVRSDISDFFTKIPKPELTAAVGKIVKDEDFLGLFSKAIKVELANLALLRGHAKAFPIEDIGVAQGNSLSPLMGNLFLYDFDQAMNQSNDVRCIRFIDDFIILAPSKSVANNSFDKARRLLEAKGLSLPIAKTDRKSVTEGFTFLGIEMCNGLIRPDKAARHHVIALIAEILNHSREAFEAYTGKGIFDARLGLVNTLRRVRSTAHGWRKHYWFCNDLNSFKALDGNISNLVRSYLASYARVRANAGESIAWDLVGIGSLRDSDGKTAFTWRTS